MSSPDDHEAIMKEVENNTTYVYIDAEGQPQISNIDVSLLADDVIPKQGIVEEIYMPDDRSKLVDVPLDPSEKQHAPKLFSALSSILDDGLAFGLVDDDLIGDLQQPEEDEGCFLGVKSKEHTATTDDPDNTRSIPNEEQKKSSQVHGVSDSNEDEYKKWSSFSGNSCELEHLNKNSQNKYKSTQNEIQSHLNNDI